MKLRSFIFFSLFALLNCQGYAQTITTVVGTPGSGGISGVGGPATAAKIRPNWTIGKDMVGNIYIGPGNTYAIYKVNTAGILTSFAGNDTVGFSGDGGPATAAKINNLILGIAADKKGNVYISDVLNYRIRKVDVSGTITTYAGNGWTTPSGDNGPATSAGLGTPNGICTDSIGNLYINAGFKIRKVDTFGIITTYAGTGVSGFSGDGGMATAAQLSSNNGQIMMDKNGDLYIADVANRRIRKVGPQGAGPGIITTVAGNGTMAFAGDGGPATNASLKGAVGVFVDSCGNIFISDEIDSRIRMVNTSGVIGTLAGDGTYGLAGDNGPASAAKFSHPYHIWVSGNDDLFIADLNNFCIRKIAFPHCDAIVFPPIDTGTGINGIADGYEASISVYPNPAKEELIVDNAKGATLRICDMVGKAVLVRSVSSVKETVSLSGLPQEMYMVQVIDEEKRMLVVKKVLKE